MCGAFDREDVRQSDKAGFCRPIGSVVVLAECAHLGCDEYEASVTLRFHRPEGRLRQVEAAVEMDAEHRSPPLRSDLIERRHLMDTGVADDRVNSTERIERDLHDRGATVGAVHRVVRDDRDAASLADLVDDLTSDSRVRAAAGHRTADVVDHDLRTKTSHFQGVETAQTAPRPGHDYDLAIKTDHGASPSSGSRAGERRSV